MRLKPKQHTKHKWIVHQLLSDFKIEDVWRLPVKLQTEHSLSDVQNEFSNALASIERKGLSGRLFQFRMFLGRVFNWDERKDQAEIVSGSIRERYAKKYHLTFNDLPAPGVGNFIPVYRLELESLSEIENTTVHAAIHLGKVESKGETSTVQMTIYVKAKGVFGKAYMLLIRPFRLYIIYPAMLKTIEHQWVKYLKESNSRKTKQ